MKARGVYLVPTLSVVDASVATTPEQWRSPQSRSFLESMRQAMAVARELGVKIAGGSDPAAVERHGRNAEDL